MAIVCVDLESTLPSWYTAAVYSAGTTYAADDYVIAAAASGLYSGTTAVLWKSLQNGNTGNALEEGAWWTVVADGSAAKPYKSIDDATRFAAEGANEIRVKKTTTTALTGAYTFYSDGGANEGKCLVSGNNPDSLAVGDIIGDYDIGFWVIYSVTYSSPNTIIVFGGTSVTTYGFASVDGLNKTPATTLKINYISSLSEQNVQSSGIDINNLLHISGGWNFADPSNPVRDGYTAITAPITFSSKNYGEIDYFIFYSTGAKFVYINSTYIIRNCYYIKNGFYNAGAVVGASVYIYDTVITQANATSDIWGGKGCIRWYNCKILRGYATAVYGISYYENCIHVKGVNNTVFSLNGATLVMENCKTYGAWANWGHAYVGMQSRDNTNDILLSNCTTDEYVIPVAGVFKIHNCNQVVGDHRLGYVEGSILSDSVTALTGMSWRYQPNAKASSGRPLDMLANPQRNGQHPFEVAVSANSQVTATIWCKKSDADSAFEAQFICKGGQLAGIASDVTAVATDSTDWQQLTIQVTPTETGVLRFGFQVWGSATATCHIDDFGVTQ